MVMQLTKAELERKLRSLSASEQRRVMQVLRHRRAERARNSLSEFVKQAWHVMEPGRSLLWNWHMEHICAHLEAVTKGRIQRLLINVPPGHSKSLLTSVFWPAWVWLQRPGWRILCGSYAMDLAIRDSVKCRDFPLPGDLLVYFC